MTEADVDRELAAAARHGNDIDRALAEAGVTMDRLRADTRARLLELETFKAVVGDAEPTAADVRAEYEANRELYTRREPRRVQMIVVDDGELAEELHRRLTAGADFLELARKHSEDDRPAELLVSKHDFPEPLAAVVFSLGENELSKPVRSDYGWHVVRAVSPPSAATSIALSELESGIRAELTRRLQRAAMKRWERELEAELDRVTSYGPGYDPNALRVGLTPERPARTQKDVADCDLPAGDYTYAELVARGCAGGFPLPGVDGPACGAPLIDVPLSGGFSSADVESGYAEYVADTAGSCVPDPTGAVVSIGRGMSRLPPAP